MTAASTGSAIARKAQRLRRLTGGMLAGGGAHPHRDEGPAGQRATPGGRNTPGVARRSRMPGPRRGRDPATARKGLGQEVVRVRQLEGPIGEAALQVAELVTEVGDDVVAERLDVLPGRRLVVDRRAGLVVGELGGAGGLQVV